MCAASNNHLFQTLIEIWRESGKISRIKFVGQSMEPKIKSMDVLFVDHKIDEIKTGDIVVFRHQHCNKLVAHRVIKIYSKDGNRRFLTKGDAPGGLDNSIGEDQLIGKVVWIERQGAMISFQVEQHEKSSTSLYPMD